MPLKIELVSNHEMKVVAKIKQQKIEKKNMFHCVDRSASSTISVCWYWMIQVIIRRQTTRLDRRISVESQKLIGRFCRLKMT